MKFDVSQSGMNAARGNANTQGHDLEGELAMLRAAVNSVSGCTGGGPLTGALDSFGNGLQQASAGMTSRVQATTTGAGNAVGAYVDGDNEMAANAGRSSAQAENAAAQLRGFGGAQ